MKKTFRQFAPGTAEYVVHHARYRASIGLTPSSAYSTERNPRKALALAQVTLRELKSKEGRLKKDCPWARDRGEPWIYVGWIKNPPYAGSDGKLSFNDYLEEAKKQRSDHGEIRELDVYPQGAVCWVKEVAAYAA